MPLPTFSPTTMNMFMHCPHQFAFYRLTNLAKGTDYARICGICAHRLIDQLYEPTKDPRPFYYQSVEALKGAWFFQWNKSVQEAKDSGRLLIEDSERENQYRYIGANCLSKYWEKNIGQKPPVERETRYQTTIPEKANILGIFDQVRAVDLNYIRRVRPELIVNGKLIDGYEPAVIVDLKTSYGSYDMTRFKNVPGLKEQIRQQFELHENLQATVYTWLREQRTGLKPIGFVWYHLRSGTTFFTYRTERDYENMFAVVDHILLNMEAMSFPMHVTNLCRYCDFLEACRDERPLLFSRPEIVPGEAQLELVPNLRVKKPFTQPRLKLRGVERRRKEHQGSVTGLGVIDLSKLPWNQPELNLELGFKEAEVF